MARQLHYCLVMKTTRYIAKCKTCNLVTSALHAGSPVEQKSHDVMDLGVVFYHHWTSGICLVCRGCGMARYAKSVRGKFSAKHVCSAKCMSSTGTLCECSCAGKNHGASFSVAS